jgi:hypothetical protein
MKATIHLWAGAEDQRQRQSTAARRNGAKRHCSLHQDPDPGFHADDGLARGHFSPRGEGWSHASPGGTDFSSQSLRDPAP